MEKEKQIKVLLREIEINAHRMQDATANEQAIYVAIIKDVATEIEELLGVSGT